MASAPPVAEGGIVAMGQLLQFQRGGSAAQVVEVGILLQGEKGVFLQTRNVRSVSRNGVFTTAQR